MDKKIEVSSHVMAILREMQCNEVTENLIYTRIASFLKPGKNKDVLNQIGNEEAKHAAILKCYTGEDIKPKWIKVWWYTALARIFGFTFAAKLMESGEENAEKTYTSIQNEVPEVVEIAKDEHRHEEELLGILDEERLQYVGAMVLGLNDALVELSGSLAGMTFALENTRLVAASGLIVGTAATLSMASSQFLSARAEGKNDALKSCTYTGMAYLFAVMMLVVPYLLIPNRWYALGLMLFNVILIIAGFNYYLAVAKGDSFKKRFTEMAAISLGVAVISFGVGLLVKFGLGVDVD